MSSSARALDVAAVLTAAGSAQLLVAWGSRSFLRLRVVGTATGMRRLRDWLSWLAVAFQRIETCMCGTDRKHVQIANMYRSQTCTTKKIDFLKLEETFRATETDGHFH